MSLFPSKNLFTSVSLYPSLISEFDFSYLNDYNSIRASKKNISLFNNLENNIIGGKERKQSLDSSPYDNIVKGKKFKGNEVK
jgi:hypothetical protein